MSDFYWLKPSKKKREKNGKEILMDNVSSENFSNVVVYLSTYANYVDVNKHEVCQHREVGNKAPMSFQNQGSLTI